VTELPTAAELGVEQDEPRLYVTVEQLAAALRIVVTDTNRQRLTECIAGAGTEIDHAIDWFDDLGPPAPDDAPALIRTVCLARAVEWWKSPDAAYGVLGGGSPEMGVIRAPRDSFGRYADALIPLKEQFGLA
jgi:hypothetical protein